MPKEYTFNKLSKDVRERILREIAAAFIEQHRKELLCELNLAKRHLYTVDGEVIYVTDISCKQTDTA